MTARVMLGTGPIQVQDRANNDTYYTKQHKLGPWRLASVDPTVYKMRAIIVATGLPEYWLTQNPNAGPPSGNAYTNKSIDAVIENMFPSNV